MELISIECSCCNFAEKEEAIEIVKNEFSQEIAKLTEEKDAEIKQLRSSLAEQSEAAANQRSELMQQMIDENERAKQELTENKQKLEAELSEMKIQLEIANEKNDEVCREKEELLSQLESLSQQKMRLEGKLMQI